MVLRVRPPFLLPRISLLLISPLTPRPLSFLASSSIFIPYYHYVPLQNNYSDLWDILSFFTARPDAAKLIGQQGRDFVLENWRWEDMQAYMLLSLLEYARVMSDDREAMTYRGYQP